MIWHVLIIVSAVWSLLACWGADRSYEGKGKCPPHRHYFQEMTEEVDSQGEPIVKSYDMEIVKDGVSR